MSELRKLSVEPNKRMRRLWILFGLAWALAPAWFGWFAPNRIECAMCFREVFTHSLTFFGYVVLGGFIYSFSRPSKGKLRPGDELAAPNGYMLGTQEDTVFTFILLGVRIPHQTGH